MRNGGIAPPFLTSEQDRGAWSASCPCRLTPEERGPHWIGGWVRFRVGPDAMEKRKILPLLGIEPQPPNPYRVAIPTELSWLWRHHRTPTPQKDMQ
jgi:hypothetical protein